MYNTKDITSIGSLNTTNGKNLTVCLRNNMHPNFFVKISNEEFEKVKSSKELMKQLACAEINKRLINFNLYGNECFYVHL